MEHCNRIKWTTSARLSLLHAYMSVEEEIRTGLFSGDEWTEVTARTWKVDEEKAQKLRNSTIKQLYDLRPEYRKYLDGGTKPPRLKNQIVRKLKALDGSTSASRSRSPDSHPSSSKEPMLSEKENTETSEFSVSTSHGPTPEVQKDGKVDRSEQDEDVEVIKEELEFLREWFEEEIVPVGTEIMKIVKDAAAKHSADHHSSMTKTDEMCYSSKLIFGLDQERVESVIRTRFIELKIRILKGLQNISFGISEELQ